MPSNPQRRSPKAALAGLVLAAVVLWTVTPRQDPSPPRTAPTAPAPVAASGTTERAALPAQTSSPPRTPDSPQDRALAIAAVERALATGSLRGASPDGAISVDGNGRLLHNLALKRWFDWHLSLVGEVPPPAIRAWIAEHLARTQPSAVREQVLRVLDAYLGYLADVDRVAALKTSGRDPAERLQLLKDLRRQHLGAEVAEAFFGDEERQGDYTLARRALQRDTALTPDQRGARLAELEAALPESVRQPLAQHRQVQADLEQSAAIAAAIADPVERFAAREQAFGAEAAARLEQLDREQTAWQQRLSDYAAARRALLADPSLDAATRESRLAQLRASHFAGTEHVRVEALEQADALPTE